MEALEMLIGTEEALAGADESGNYITLNQDTGDMDLYLDGQKTIGINEDRLEGKQDKIGEVIEEDGWLTLNLEKYLSKIKSDDTTGLTISGRALALDSYDSDRIWCNGKTLTRVGSPTEDDDAATKLYVDRKFLNDNVTFGSIGSFQILSDSTDVNLNTISDRAIGLNGAIITLESKNYGSGAYQPIKCKCDSMRFNSEIVPVKEYDGTFDEAESVIPPSSDYVLIVQSCVETASGVWAINHNYGIIKGFECTDFQGLEPGTIISTTVYEGKLYVTVKDYRTENPVILSGIATPSETPTESEDLTVAVNLDYIRKLEARIAALELSQPASYSY